MAGKGCGGMMEMILKQRGCPFRKAAGTGAAPMALLYRVTSPSDDFSQTVFEGLKPRRRIDGFVTLYDGVATLP